MVHKLIRKITEEVIEPKDEEDVKKILGKAEKESKEEETDVMDDYDEGMKEFTDSLGGKEEKEQKDVKPEEIRALG